MVLAIPRLPRPTTLRVCHNNSGQWSSYTIQPEQSLILRRGLPNQGGFIELLVDQMFQPSVVLGGDDQRTLGCMCSGCEIVSPTGVTDLLQQAKRAADAT
jgi:hypothetical protein